MKLPAFFYLDVHLPPRSDAEKFLINCTPHWWSSLIAEVRSVDPRSGAEFIPYVVIFGDVELLAYLSGGRQIVSMFSVILQAQPTVS